MLHLQPLFLFLFFSLRTNSSGVDLESLDAVGIRISLSEQSGLDVASPDVVPFSFSPTTSVSLVSPSSPDPGRFNNLVASLKLSRVALDSIVFILTPFSQKSDLESATT